MFSGSSRMKVDAKARLAVPKQFRDLLPDGSFISIGPEMNLTIYPREEWEQLRGILKPPLTATKEERELARALNSLAVACEFDQQGRVTLSQEQRRVAGIDPESTVVVAGNGREALTAWERQAFDAILMDVQMPEMDGLTATTAIREKEKATGGHIPIVALTAHAMSGDRERALVARAVAGDAPGQNLAALGDEPAQAVDLFVVDVGRLFRAERTDFALRLAVLRCAFLGLGLRRGHDGLSLRSCWLGRLMPTPS